MNRWLAGGMLFLSSAPLYALQGHAGIEGLVAHEMAHLLLLIGVMVMLSTIRRRRGSDRGWRAFRGFLWLMALWTVVAFVGHLLPATPCVLEGTAQQAGAVPPVLLALHALIRLDDLILVPALSLLLLSVVRWSRKP